MKATYTLRFQGNFYNYREAQQAEDSSIKGFAKNRNYTTRGGYSFDGMICFEKNRTPFWLKSCPLQKIIFTLITFIVCKSNKSSVTPLFLVSDGEKLRCNQRCSSILILILPVE